MPRKNKNRKNKKSKCSLTKSPNSVLLKHPNNTNDVLEELNEYRKSEEHKFCDWILKTSDGAEFHVHKNVIALTCGYFKCLFNTPFSEIKDDSMTLTNISGNSLARILDYLYTGEIEFGTENVKEIFESASYLLIDRLQELIANYLETKVNAQTCLEFWRFGDLASYKCEKLIEKSLEYILKNAEVLFTKSFVEKLKFEEINTIIKNCKINCSEDKILEAVIWWLEANGENRETYTEKLLNQIRFLFVSDNFMISNVFDRDLLTSCQMYGIKIAQAFKTRLQIDQGHFTLHYSVVPRIRAVEKESIILYNNECHSLSNNFVVKQKESLKSPFKTLSKTVFKNNFLFVSGLGTSDFKNCQYYCPIQNKWRNFPAMKESRQNHGATFLNDKIYVCGGLGKNTTEYFDTSKEQWFSGPNFSSIRFKFGVCSSDNCIYAVGGQSNLIEYLDLRERVWNKISSGFNNISNAQFYQDSLYCMSTEGWKVFDLRKNKWIENCNISLPFTNIQKSDFYITNNKIYCTYIHSNNINNNYTTYNNTSYNSYISVYDLNANANNTWETRTLKPNIINSEPRIAIVQMYTS